MALCPKCKEPVSQFAAGCAVCGTDLEKHRRAVADRRSARRIRLPGLPQVGEAEVLIGLLALVVLAYPFAGIALALLAAFRHPQMRFPGSHRTVLFALVAAGVCVAVATDGVGVLLY